MRKYQEPSDILKYKDEIALEIFFKDLKESASLISIKEKYVQDTIYTLGFLATSAQMNEPLIFINYMKWFGSLAHHLKFSLENMKRHLKTMLQMFYQIFDEKLLLLTAPILKQGIDAFEEAFLNTTQHKINYDPFLNHLLQMESDLAYQFILNEIEKGMTIKEIYLNVLQPTLYKVGDLWHQRTISVAKEHYMTAAIQNIIGRLYPMLFTSIGKSKYSMTAVCAGEELHEIGMRMVADFFEISNWDTYFLGSNIPISQVLIHLNEKPTDLLAISATTSQQLMQVKELIETVKSTKSLKKIKIIVGGKVFNETPNLWKSVGADGHAFDAEQAVLLGSYLVGESNG